MMSRLRTRIKDDLPLAIVCLAAFGCGGSSGGDGQSPTYSATLSWDSPTTNSDGTQLMDLAGFRVYKRTKQGSYSFVADAGTNTAFTVSSLAQGTHEFAVTAYDFFGNESVFSEEASVILPLSGDTVE